VSIEYIILCTRSPAAFLKKKAKWLTFDARKKSGAFGGMSLDLRSLEEWDKLPEPSFAERVVAVLHADGRLSNDTYDDFDEWTRALAEATHGAVYSPMAGEFLYVWADADEAKTRARASALLEAGDFAALTAWVVERGEAHARAKHKPDPAWLQLGWIDELAEDALEPLVAAGDARPAQLIVALHHAFSDSFDRDRLRALVIAAARLPGLPRDSELIGIAAEFEARRLRDLAVRQPPPRTLADLNLLLDGVLREDPVSLLRFASFADASPRTVRPQEIVVELAASGRALPDAVVQRLLAVVYGVDALQTAAARAAFASHGALARALCEAEAARQARSERDAEDHARSMARLRAENNALYGIKRNRPCTPPEVVALVCSGDLAAAAAKYRELCPHHTAQAEQAVEDAHAFYAPS
jgi:hypothetical protein